MALAIVYVFPDPVTPSRVWYDKPSSTPATSASIACG